MEIPRTTGVEPTPREIRTANELDADVLKMAELPQKTCLEEYGQHKWVQHEDTLMEYCENCTVRKDVWEEKSDQFPDNNGKEKGNDYEVGYGKPPQETQIKPGEVRNPNGRPKGSRNLTTIVMEALRNKTYTLKDEATGKTSKISGEEAFAEAVLEVAIKNKDREGLRMIWEFNDGKPTQQHKIDLGPVRGYEIPEAEEDKLKEEFSMVFNTPMVVALEPTPDEAKPAQNEELTPKPDETTGTPA